MGWHIRKTYPLLSKHLTPHSIQFRSSQQKFELDHNFREPHNSNIQCPEFKSTTLEAYCLLLTSSTDQISEFEGIVSVTQSM